MKNGFVELLLEVLVGLFLMGVGFGLLWVFRGEAAWDTSGTNAWLLGMSVVGAGGVGILATREWLSKRKKR